MRPKKCASPPPNRDAIDPSEDESLQAAKNRNTGRRPAVHAAAKGVYTWYPDRLARRSPIQVANSHRHQSTARFRQTGMNAFRRSKHRRLRVYRSLRSAHLERARTLTSATILYNRRREDFDIKLTEGLDLVRTNPLGTFLTVLISDLDAIEINEPLMGGGLWNGLSAVVAARLSELVRQRPIRVVTYAIENLNPFSARVRLRSRLRARAEIALASLLARNLDRIAFGTEGARSLYIATMGRALRKADCTTIAALPAACTCLNAVPCKSGSVLFLGALDDRKGFPSLVAAWPEVQEHVAGAQLTVIGKGPLEGLARELEQHGSAVRVLIDPPRDTIHAELRAATALVLLSKPTQYWREQVGLPIVEALAHGCTVLTTDQTGLAGWLAAHGHVVISSDAQPPEIAREINTVLREPRSPDSVLTDLAAIDGRIQADEWMFSPPAP